MPLESMDLILKNVFDQKKFRKIKKFSTGHTGFKGS